MLTKDLKKFLEENIELIETNRFDELYKRAQTTLYFSQGIGTLTRSLNKAGIDPLPHLEWVPYCYLYGDSTLETITIPDNIMFIESEAFGNCNLKKVTFGKRVDVVYYGAFEGCTMLTDVHLNEGLLEIGQYAFKGTNIERLRLPSTLRNIDVQAFPEVVLMEVFPGTYAHEWAVTNGYEVELIY